MKRTSLKKELVLFLNKFFSSIKRETIDGASLPDNTEERQKDVRLLVGVISSAALFIILLLSANMARLTFHVMSQPGFNFFTQTIDEEKIFAEAINIAKILYRLTGALLSQ